MTDSGMEDKLSRIINQLDDILQKRDAIFPDRNAENDKRMSELSALFVDTVNCSSGQTGHSTKAIQTETAAQLSESCLFLCGYMKCGTTLLLELLDSHPELIALPGDAWFKGRRYLDCANASEVYSDDFRDKWLARIVNPTGQAPFWLYGKTAGPYIDFVDHFNAWNRYFNDPGKGHLLSTVLAYFSANPTRPDTPRMWVEKTPGNEFETERILSYFPNARFLHIVRDPRENFASLKRLYQTRAWNWEPYSQAGKIGESCRQAVINQENFGKERYLVLDYESLTADPRASLEKICDFLGISWNDSLLTPTINSIPAQANTMYGDRKITGGVRPATKDKWRSVLSPQEKRAILCTLDSAKMAGYNWKVSKGDYLVHAMDKMKNRLKSAAGQGKKNE